jgi:hypothetical protein
VLFAMGLLGPFPEARTLAKHASPLTEGWPFRVVGRDPRVGWLERRPDADRPAPRGIRTANTDFPERRTLISQIPQIPQQEQVGLFCVNL